MLIEVVVSTPQGTQIVKVDVSILGIFLLALRAQPEREIWTIHVNLPPEKGMQTITLLERRDGEWEGRTIRQSVLAF